MTTELAISSSLVEWAHEAEAAAGIARAMVGTAFVPDSLKVYDERHNLDLDATVAQVTAALLTGQELGMAPMASLRSIDVIPPGSGSPALRAAALRGLLQQHGHDIWVVESTETRAVVRGRRAGTELVQESTWTIDRARKMQLRGFGDSRGSWQRQPAAMLVARATSEVARWIGSDVLLGLPYTTDDIEDGELEAAPGGEIEQPHPPAAARRKASRRPSQAPAASPSPVKALPPAAAHPAADEATGQEVPAAPPPKMNAAQRAALWAGLRRLGLTVKDECLAAVSGWVGRDIASSNDLTADEASRALDAIKADEARRAVAADQDSAADPLPEGPTDDD